MQGEHLIQRHGFHKAEDESRIVCHQHYLVQVQLHELGQSHEPSRAAPTHTPGFACGAPHVKLLSSGVEPRRELCLCITGLRRNVFLWLQCIQYGLDILKFHAAMNLDIQGRAFDRRAQPRVTQSWDSHVICRCKMQCWLYTTKYTKQVLFLHCSPGSTLYVVVLRQLQKTWNHRKNEEPNTHPFGQTPSPMLPLNC